MVTGGWSISHEGGQNFWPRPFLLGHPGWAAEVGDRDGGDGEDVEADDEFDEEAVHFVSFIVLLGVHSLPTF